MASANVPGVVTLYIRKKTGPHAGEMIKCYSNSTDAIGGACPDGVPGRAPGDWLSIPLIPKVKGMPDDELVVTLKVVTGATLDASDAIWCIPMTFDSGFTTLGNNATDFDVLALADTAYVAATETICAIHKFKEAGFVGGGKALICIQNNA